MKKPTMKINKAGLAKMTKMNDTMLRDVTELTREGSAEHSPVGSPVHTGNNRDTIQWKKIKDKQYIVFTESGYGGWLEIGTKKMDARPYIRPAYAEAKRVMEGRK